MWTAIWGRQPDRTCDVDKNVQLAPGLDRNCNHLASLLVISDVAIIGDRLAAHGTDLVGDLLRRRGVSALAERGSADVGNHDLRTLLSHG
jgi:hypothetical protein